MAKIPGKRWYELYRVGDQVVTRVVLANGTEWRAGSIARKTASGLPVVRVAFEARSVDLVVSRKADIQWNHEAPIFR